MTFNWATFPKEEFGVQINPYFRRAETAFMHWCPGCEEMHPLPDTWRFDGNFERPTFDPSFKHTGSRGTEICHYLLVNGVLHFLPDSTHKLAGQSVPLPVLPEAFRD